MNDRNRIWQIVTRILFEESRAGLNARLGAELVPTNAFWEQAISIANVSSVTAAVWSKLKLKGLTDCVSADAHDYLASFHDINTSRNEAILEQLFECAAALNSAGIRPMPIKGTAYLLGGLYADIGERFLTDIDIMVPADRAEEAFDIFNRLGYRSRAVERSDSATHKLAPLVKSGRPAELECHTAPVPEALEPALPTREMWADAVPQTAGGAQFVLPAAVDSLINSFLHAVIIDRCFVLYLFPLRFFYDAHLLLATHGHEIDEREIIDRANRVCAFGKLRTYAYALHRLGGRNLLTSLDFSLMDRWQFAICRAAAGRQWTASDSAMIRWLIRLDCFSEYSLRNRYGIGDNGAMLTVYRLRECYEMTLRGLRKLALSR